MKIKSPFYPIIYVRGYAATMGQIEKTSATPYMGFNLGSVKKRQNHKGEIVRFIFESPLIRLMKDEGYIDAYTNGDFVPIGKKIQPKSIWIFRYYEKASEELGTGKRQSIQEIAVDLREFILRIRDHVCGTDNEERNKFKVYLVAHSMGGLVCRCYIQNICFNGVTDLNGKKDPERNKVLELPGDSLVDKVFTYGTPHNGIEFLGINVPDLGPLDAFHSSNFNRDKMRIYLDLPEDSERVDSLNGRFPPDRFFSFIGTNYKDYDAFSHLSKKVTGPMSDGLVMIKNAAVKDSPRAFAYRSHSGEYGMVNSEEGYQNLKRFLFGQFRIDVKLLVEEITLPRSIKRLADEGKEIMASYYIETTAQVRGAGYFLNERRHDQQSAILYNYIKKKNKPVYLFSGYLDRRAKTPQSKGKTLSFAMRISIKVPLYEVNNKFWFDDHYEGGDIINQTIIFYVPTNKSQKNIKYCFLGESTEKECKLHPINNIGSGILIPLGFKQGQREVLRPGFRGKLMLSIFPWNT
jgi:hypothetical protein